LWGVRNSVYSEVWGWKCDMDEGVWEGEWRVKVVHGVCSVQNECKMWKWTIQNIKSNLGHEQRVWQNTP
jgi:hypothetical protein